MKLDLHEVINSFKKEIELHYKQLNGNQIETFEVHYPNKDLIPILAYKFLGEKNFNASLTIDVCPWFIETMKNGYNHFDKESFTDKSEIEILARKHAAKYEDISLDDTIKYYKNNLL